MKAARYEQPDEEAIREVSRTEGFDRETLVERFVNEMTHVGAWKKIAERFVAMIEMLYGEEEAGRIEKRLLQNPP